MLVLQNHTILNETQAPEYLTGPSSLKTSLGLTGPQAMFERPFRPPAQLPTKKDADPSTQGCSGYLKNECSAGTKQTISLLCVFCQHQMVFDRNHQFSVLPQNWI